MPKAPTTQTPAAPAATEAFSKLYADYNRMASEFGKMFVNGKVPFVNVESVLASQRKNIEAVAAANQVAVEAVQAIVRRQVEIARETVDDFTSQVKELTESASPEERIARQTEAAKAVVETTIANLRELTGLIRKAGDEAVDVISKRVVANMDEVKSAFGPKAAA